MLRQPTRAVCELSHICGDRFSLLAAHSHSRLFEQRSDIRGSMAGKPDKRTWVQGRTAASHRSSGGGDHHPVRTLVVAAID
jgi:hypothetical protein